MSIVLDAQEFATKKHGKQKYTKILPYTYHLKAAHDVAERYNLNVDIRAAAWLHDILEDTNITVVELRAFFGHHIAGLVQLVTDEPGKNRKERAEKTWPKIRTSPEAVALKLCDRIANVQASLDIGPQSLLDMYKKEHKRFRAALTCDDEDEWLLAMWAELDELIRRK